MIREVTRAEQIQVAQELERGQYQQQAQILSQQQVYIPLLTLYSLPALGTKLTTVPQQAYVAIRAVDIEAKSNLFGQLAITGTERDTEALVIGDAVRTPSLYFVQPNLVRANTRSISPLVCLVQSLAVLLVQSHLNLKDLKVEEEEEEEEQEQDLVVLRKLLN